MTNKNLMLYTKPLLHEHARQYAERYHKFNYNKGYELHKKPKWTDCEACSVMYDAIYDFLTDIPTYSPRRYKS